MELFEKYINENLSKSEEILIKSHARDAFETMKRSLNTWIDQIHVDPPELKRNPKWILTKKKEGYKMLLKKLAEMERDITR